MYTLIVDAEGKIVIPPEITREFGLRPGDELGIYRTPDGLLLKVISREVSAFLDEWWNSMTEEEKVGAHKEAD